MTVTLVHDDTQAQHDRPDHPENAQRLIAVRTRLAAHPDVAEFTVSTADAAEDDALHAVHDAALLISIERVAAGGGGWLDADTYCTARSWDVARRAAGAAIHATDVVVRGDTSSAFALVRPPGHHATTSRPMGFCLVNNVAVAARWAQRRHGMGRVAIIDIDVHHGNGTQDIFEEDPSVLYASLHQWPLYPGTGRRGDIGRGAGAGATVNVPVPAGTGTTEWLTAFDTRVAPALRAHAPDVILVSAGFDGHRADPLANLDLDTGTFAQVAGRIRELAGDLCAGRTVWVLEGGYDLTALPDSVVAVLGALHGEHAPTETPA